MSRCSACVALATWSVVMQGAGAGEGADLAGDVRWGELPHTDTVFKPTKYASLAEWENRGQWLRDQVRFAAGLYPERARTPLNAKRFG